MNNSNSIPVTLTKQKKKGVKMIISELFRSFRGFKNMEKDRKP